MAMVGEDTVMPAPRLRSGPVDPGLLQAYVGACYEVRLHDGWCRLRVGEPAARLEAALPAPAYAVISAWNPGSQRRSGAGNRRADADLRARLGELGLACLRSRSRDAYGRWQEEGWMAAAPTPVQADRLAARFGQAAILYWQAQAPVGLRLYRPPPALAALPPWVVVA